MSDRPEETSPEDSLDEAAEQPADQEEADTESAGTDDEVIAELEKDLPADDGPAIIKRKTAKAPVRRKAAKEGAAEDESGKKKGRPTRKRRDSATQHRDPYKANNPAQFVTQSVDELKKVVWPTWPSLVRYFFAVLAFVLFVIVLVFLLDGAFGWGLLQILGR